LNLFGAFALFDLRLRFGRHSFKLFLSLGLDEFRFCKVRLKVNVVAFSRLGLCQRIGLKWICLQLAVGTLRLLIRLGLEVEVDLVGLNFHMSAFRHAVSLRV
jgi:hypothetical protein